jgi:hypothetical protein
MMTLIVIVMMIPTTLLRTLPVKMKIKAQNMNVVKLMAQLETLSLLWLDASRMCLLLMMTVMIPVWKAPSLGSQLLTKSPDAGNQANSRHLQHLLPIIFKNTAAKRAELMSQASQRLQPWKLVATTLIMPAKLPVNRPHLLEHLQKDPPPLLQGKPLKI